MCAGLFLVPMLLIGFHRFSETSTSLSMKEFFWAFTVVYVSLLAVCKGPTTKALETLRAKLGSRSPTDVRILAPMAAKSSDVEIVALGHKYWFWQLIGGYLTGVFFSWVAGIFFVFFV